MSKKLLLADDSVVIQKLIGLSFANEDIEIFSTDNGDDALTKAREIKPDVILADVVMPGLSGYEVCEAIKQDPELARTPVLLLTGTFEAFDEARAASAGANGQITKPFEAQALVDRVTEAMNAPAATPTLESPVDAASTLPPARAGAQDAPLDVSPHVSPHASAASLDAEPADDLFDGDFDSLDASDLATDSLSTDDLGLDLPEEDSGAPAFPAVPNPNENTASGLFGAPGEGASSDFDSHAGSLSLGESVSGAPPRRPVDDATIAVQTEPPAPLSPLPAARPVDLDAALAGAPESAEPSLLVARDDVNASTSPNLAAALGSELARAGATEDLTIHSPSADIDQDRAASPSPAAASREPGQRSSVPVADLDADLAASSRGAETRGGATPAPSVDAGAETVVASIDTTDPLDFRPTNIPTDDLDFAFDVSEQVAAENLADRARYEGPDSYGDSFSSLMDISESQILGSHAAEAAADRSDSQSRKAESRASGSQRPETAASETTEASPAPISAPTDSPRTDDAIMAGYDVSTSDLATADTSFRRDAATPPPIPEPERLDVLPELPQARTPGTRSQLITGDDDLFDGLATGSPLDEIEPPERFAPGSDLDIDDDLLAEDDSVEIGEAIPARSSSGAVPPEINARPETHESPTSERGRDESVGEAAYVSAAGAVGVSAVGAAAAHAVGAAGAHEDPSEFDEVSPATRDASASIEEDITEDVPAGEIADGSPHDDESLQNEIAIGSMRSQDEDRRIPDLSPMMEQRIQETLEKVAWEAFSDLSESIVKQVMTRVEQIAWEVVPEMAETLVREEIRKMKGDED